MKGSIASMKRLTVIAVVGVIVGAVSSTTRVVTAMRTSGVAIAVIAFMNPNIIIAEKTVVVTTVVVSMAVIVIRGSVRVIHTGTQENGGKQADREGQEGLHECRTEGRITLFGRTQSSQYGKSCFVPCSRDGHANPCDGEAVIKSRYLPRKQGLGSVIRRIRSMRIQCAYNVLP